MQRILNAGARSQRLLWASTGAKDPDASQLIYVQTLAKPFTVNTIPKATLKALDAHEEFGEALPGHADGVLGEFTKVGIDTAAVAAQLLSEGIESFAKSWSDLITCITLKREAVKPA